MKHSGGIKPFVSLFGSGDTEVSVQIVGCKPQTQSDRVLFRVVQGTGV